MTEEAVAGGGSSGARSSLVDWLHDQGLLRGPHVYADYWGSVLDLAGLVPERLVRDGLVDPALYRVGLDRPDLELPRLRHYLLLFLIGPFLIPFRSFRRLGRYRLSYRSEVGRRVAERLRELELELRRRGEGRVDVTDGEAVLARDVLDPARVAGFCSLFYATYKLPIASLTAIVLAGLLAPVLQALGWLTPVLEYWIPVGFPLLVLLLYAVFRDWVTAVLGAFPVVVTRLLLPVLVPTAGSGPAGWLEFVGALLGLFGLYLLVDWFFMPRPVPPALLLYTTRGPGRPYDREEDAPWWLDGEAYWVWRYLMLAPAEINKFWERDWERVELWVRADGPDAGELEWVVTDSHYRELWIPYEKLGPESRLRRHRESAARALREGEAGFWLLEADADLLFHAPILRAVSFVPEEERIPARSVGHILTALWKQAEADRPDEYRTALELAQLRLGRELLQDVPEVAARLVARHLLAEPWRYWRFPLGAATRRESRVYEGEVEERPPPAADPALQIKEGSRGLP